MWKKMTRPTITKAARARWEIRVKRSHCNSFDEGEPRFCPICDGQIDNGYGGEGVEVDGYSECFDCLLDDPEIVDELKETPPISLPLKNQPPAV